MTRRIRYANQLAISLFDLQDQKEFMIELAQLASAILGSTTEFDGFACNPSVVPDLNVHVGSGTLFSYQNVDNTPFGTAPTQIPADTTNQILKLAYQLGSTTFAITPPSTVGYSRNDLIQIAFLEQDGTPTSVPFYAGAGQPPIFQTVNVLRSDSVVITIVTGVAAPTGTQVTPAPTAGATGMWVVTTTQGQTTITSGNIAAYPGAPFITEKLKDKISQATADARYLQTVAFQNSTPIYTVDTGTVNTIVCSITPALTSYNAGQHLLCKILNTNTGATTINVNGRGAKNIVDQFGNPLLPGDLQSGMIADLTYDGTNYQLANRASGLNVSIVGGVYMSTAQTLSATTKLAFDTVQFDTNSLWDAVNLRWNIGKNGYYRINCTCLIQSAVSANPGFALHKNGTIYKTFNEMPGSGSTIVLAGNNIIECNAGDYLEMYGYPNGGSPVYGGAGAGGTALTNSSFQLEFIGQP